MKAWLLLESSEVKVNDSLSLYTHLPSAENATEIFPQTFELGSCDIRFMASIVNSPEMLIEIRAASAAK
jgi:hypothetical protein